MLRILHVEFGRWGWWFFLDVVFLFVFVGRGREGLAKSFSLSFSFSLFFRFLGGRVLGLGIWDLDLWGMVWRCEV